MKSLAVVVIGAGSLVGSADAGFLGFVAFARQSGSYLVVDVYTAVANASDKFLNVYNANITTTAPGGFYQGGGLANKTWKPDAAGFSSTRNSRNSLDSFVTAGTDSGGAYGGEYYASPNTNADPNFTGTSWSGTPSSLPASTMPALSGWYTGDPTSVDNNAQALSQFASGKLRIDTLATAGPGGTPGSVGASYGIWCAHLVIVGSMSTFTMPPTISWDASASIKDGVSGGTSQGRSVFATPTPGAIALLAVAGFSSRRRRA